MINIILNIEIMSLVYAVAGIMTAYYLQLHLRTKQKYGTEDYLRDWGS